MRRFNTIMQGKTNGGNGPESGTVVVTRTQPKTRKPSLYRVLLLNDDYTPMEFVVHVLQRFSRKIWTMRHASCCMFTIMVSASVACSLTRLPKPKSVRSWISPVKTSIRCNA